MNLIEFVIKSVILNMNKEHYRYNFIGLFGVAVNKGIQRETCIFLFSICGNCGE